MKMERIWVPVTASYGESAQWFAPARLAVGLALSAIVWLLAWHWHTVDSLIATWRDNQTFAHGFLIAPISLWMIWRRRQDLAALELRPNFLVLPLLALVGVGWLLGHTAGVVVVQQYGLVLMVLLMVWAILGNQVVRALAFPLAFLLLAVPFGDFLIPSLMGHTADFTVFALRLTGIPVYREGLFFTIPSGSWSVVEACSGLRYLIACVTGGLLYAYLRYQSFARRAIFVAVSVIVPIVANWLRAYMIVMIQHVSGGRYGVDIDHLIYGWVFFGIVTLILFWIGSFWREDLQPRPTVHAFPSVARTHKHPMPAIMAATIAAAMVVAIWPVAASRLDDASSVPVTVLQAPSPAPGWQPLTERMTDWTPRFLKPTAQIDQAYGGNTNRAGIYIAYYSNQQKGAQLISSLNRLVASNDSEWRDVGDRRRTLVSNDKKLAVTEAQLHGRSMRLLVWLWYWVDGEYTANPYRAKLLQAKSKLLGRGDNGAVIIVYTKVDKTRDAAAGQLHDFVDAMLPAITVSLGNAR